MRAEEYNYVTEQREITNEEKNNVQNLYRVPGKVASRTLMVFASILVAFGIFRICEIIFWKGNTDSLSFAFICGYILSGAILFTLSAILDLLGEQLVNTRKLNLQLVYLLNNKMNQETENPYSQQKE